MRTEARRRSRSAGGETRPDSLEGRRPLLALLSRPFLSGLAKAGYDPNDPDVALRTGVVLLYVTVSSLVGYGYAASHWERGSAGVTVLFLFFGSATIVQLAVLRLTGRLRLVSHATLLVAVVCTSAATYYTGGLRMTNVCPFFIVIVAAIFLLGWEGLVWAFLALFVPIGFEVASRSGVVFPDHVPPAGRADDALLTWLVGLIVVFLFVVCYEAARQLSLRRREQAEAARSQFLANVSHELRTPLHAIMGMTRHALRSDLPADIAEALETAQHNADALLVLINDLLDLASMDRDRFVLHERDFDPGDVVERVAKVARFRCAERGLDFSCEVATEVPRWVWGDGDRLQQVLTNLCGNAVKYTAEGSVELSATVEETDDDARQCRFSVVDTGIGIGDGDRESLFDPFSQVDGVSTRAQEGSGLGLSIVREIVAAMRGRVDLESAPGQGSAFHVIVPFEPARSDRAEPATGAAAQPSKSLELKVLLVDDDAVNVQMATMMLDELSVEVVVARDGQQAIEQWEAERPDLVLMDLQMPGMNGLEAIRRIRRREAETGREQAPILAVTGHGTEFHREQCESAGASDCLFKPFRFEELRDAVARLFRPAAAE